MTKSTILDSEITQVKVISFTETLKKLQANEWISLGLTPPEPCQEIKLPDGRDDIHRRLWDVFSKHHNFSNDILFSYTFSSINAEKLSDDLQTLYNYCEAAIVNHQITFKVCW